MEKSVNIFALVVLLNIFMGTVSCGQDSTGSQQGEVTIASVAPSEVAVGDTLTISGSHFGESGSNTVVFIRKGSEKLASPVEASNTQLKVVVPDAIGKAEVTVKVGKGNRAATPQGVTITASKKDRIVKQYIKDPHFKKGFKLTPLSTDSIIGGFANSYVDTLGFGNGTSSPIWRLTQWWSDYSLEGARPTEADDGSIVYSNPGKKVALYPDHSLLLEVNGSREYDRPREKDEDHVHLIISQQLDKYGSIAVKKDDKIILSAELKLVKAENKMAPEDYNPHLHTAHTPLGFVVRNKGVNSADYNNFFYMQIPCYDYRNRSQTSGRLIGRDRGNNRLMYRLSNTDVWGNINFNDKKWHRGEVDLKPHIKKALEAVHDIGAFTDTEMSDLKIERITFGWEVSGTFDSAIKVKDMSLKTVQFNQ